MHFDPGQLTTLTNLLYGLSGLGLGTAGGAILATREVKAANEKAAADGQFEAKAVMTMMDAIGRMQDATIALQRVLFKVNSREVAETRRTQP